jgi:phosphate transport system protein
MVRARFDQKLNELHVDIAKMGGLVEAAIRSSIEAFRINDLKMCKEIIENDKVIDEMEKVIESKCLWLIAREQPVASDLRKTTTALKLLTDMERIGDHAEDIADLTMRIAEKNTFADSSHIHEMAAVAIDMVNSAITAYINSDLELARETIKRDDVVDDYFNLIKHELAQTFKTQPYNLDNAIDYLQIAKYLERIGDHAVNICEWVLFSQTGEHKNTKVF